MGGEGAVNKNKTRNDKRYWEWLTKMKIAIIAYSRI